MILRKKKSHSDFPKLGNQHKPEITEWISNRLSAPMLDLCQETPYCLFPGKVAPVVRLGLDKLKPATETGWHDWLPSSPSTELQVPHQLWLTFLNQQQMCSELPRKGAAGQDANSCLSSHFTTAGRTSAGICQNQLAEPGRVWIATGRPEAPEELEPLTSKC